MKKILALLLALGMLLSLTACSEEKSLTGGTRNNQQGIAGAIPTLQTEAENDSAAQTETPAQIPAVDTRWRVSYLTDEAGRPTDKACTAVYAVGTFGNGSNGAGLVVNVIDAPACSNADFIASIGFELLEYGSTPAVYSSGDRVIMRVQVGDKVTEEELFGAAPTGMLFVYNSGKYPSALYAAIYNAMIRNSGEINCTIIIGSTEYSFRLSADGFVEACNTALKEYGYDWDVSQHPIN